MSFVSVPILEKMKTFYETTPTPERFSSYLKMLQGGAKDLKVPIAGYNPMAKGHIVTKLNELISLDAEKITRDVLYAFNQDFETNEFGSIEVILNLADDLKGGWTNRFSTDYDSKFKLNALLERNFCSPFFWTSEEFSTEIIKIRVQEYALRSFYVLKNGRAKTLNEHINQEIFVASNSEDNYNDQIDSDAFRYLKIHEEELDYNLIFNFLYGDEISKSLNYPIYGLQSFAGYHLAKAIAQK
ncbi:hypothetical protein N9B82_05725 [Saprospiraceae bacterium]|nr:hypothetical protein [Saprospiraceae bacterium]